MNLFKRRKNSKDIIAKNNSNHLYQYSNGSYLPDTSQPNPDENYQITAKVYSPHKSTRYLNVVIGSKGVPQLRSKDGKWIDIEKPLPELYKNRKDCCGCTACCSVCSVHAIVMRPCEEGFLYPVIDASKCVRCYKCMNICPIKEKNVRKHI